MTPAKFDKILAAKDASGHVLVALRLLFDPRSYSYLVIFWVPNCGWQQSIWNLSRDCPDTIDCLQRVARHLLGTSPKLGQSHRIHSYEIISPPGGPSVWEPRGDWLLAWSEKPPPQAPERAEAAPA